ncbi:MAG TPA: hypothetical protein VNZ64_21205 [Candidatus Acidoferrum sp.]|nr:hypothetical protein [Candidatus Acidoferrum sp.]
MAHHRGLTLEQVRALQHRCGFSNDDILRLTQAQLVQLWWEAEHPNADLHAEELRFRLLHLRDERGQIPPDAWMRAARQARQMPFDPRAWPAIAEPARQNNPGALKPRIAGIRPSGWTWLGPGNIGGRVRSILVSPANPSVMWVGGVDGGVWKTTDGGASWSALDDFMADLAIGCMTMDAANPNVIYAGTGEGFFNIDSVRGAGIFKSADGGSTWLQLSATTNSGFYYVNRLAVQPTNSLILLAATGSGIYRSTDGGSTWSQNYNTRTLDLAFNPADGTHCVASGSGIVLYSIDAGLSWTLGSGISGAGRIEVAYAPSSPSTVYASADMSSGQLYVSTDGGQTYTLKNTGTNYLGGQGWYDNCLWVDPVDPNTLIVGGLDLWLSTDGGATLTDIGGYTGGLHPDQHVIVNVPQFDGTNNRTVLFGNDGGVFRAADIATVTPGNGWATLNHNLGITQFYGAAGNPASGTIVGGTQDNGTLRYTPVGGPQGWTSMFGGDGGFCAADQGDTNYFYGEYVDLAIHRSSNGGATSRFIYNGLGDAGKSANFIAPFILDPNNQSTLLAGGASLWRSLNVKASTPVWAAIKPADGSGNHISAIAVAPGNSDLIWVGHNNGDVFFTTNGTATTPDWTRADQGTPPLPNRYCTRITVDPSNSSQVYVTFGGFSAGNVWRTLDNGATWVNVSGNLPDAPVNSLVVHPLNSGSLYVGTEVGVFASADGGASWSPGNDGPANVAVDELFWLGTNTLVAATHGRGLFSISVPVAPSITSQPQPANLTVLVGQPASFSVAGSGSLPLAYLWLFNGVAIPGATASVYSLAASQVTNTGAYSVVVTNLGGAVASSNAYLTVIPTVPLPFALNNSNLTWTTGSGSPWYGQTTVSYDGVASGRSYFISAAQQSILTTTVTGPATLGFWWKVSSQTNADIFSFVDSANNFTNGAQISGEVDWNYQGYFLPAGPQTLQWAYTKDNAGSAGLDAAFLDQVTLVSTGTPPQILSQPVGQGFLASTPVTFTVGAFGTPILAYQWLFNGSPIPGATASSLNLAAAGPFNGGFYSVQVTNAYGSALSAKAYLAIVPLVARGDDSLGQINVPSVATNTIAIAAGAWHSLVLRADGTLLAWGNNYDGQCNVSNLRNIMVIAAGGYHSLAIQLDGTVVGWGANSSGQATPPAGLSNVTALAAGTWHSLALRADGTVVAWGDNSLGQSSVPPDLTNAVAIASNGNHSLALRADGTVVAWGDNTDASGSFAGESIVPSGLAHVAAIGAGDYNSLAAAYDGTLTAWGDNSQGQSQPPESIAGVIGVTGGGSHAIALKSDSTVVAWGNDWNGQCDFSPAISNVVAIAAGNAHSLLLEANPLAPPQLLAPRRQGSQFNVWVQTFYGKSYALEYNTSPSAAGWTTLAVVRGNGARQFLVDPSATSPQRFYRVRQF